VPAAAAATTPAATPDRGASLAVVVGAAVDGVGVGFGVFDALAHHVDVRAEFLGRVPLPAVREPERPERGRVGLVREDALERLGRRLRARQVVGRLVAGAADIGHQPFGASRRTPESPEPYAPFETSNEKSLARLPSAGKDTDRRVTEGTRTESSRLSRRRARATTPGTEAILAGSVVLDHIIG